jgi:hypothetical protein
MLKTDLSMELRDAILVLEKRQAEEGKILKDQFLLLYESVKPINLIKKTFKDISESRDLKETVINSSVGLATGYVSKKLFVGTSHNPLKKLFGTVLMFGITNLISKNAGTIKSVGGQLLKSIISKAGNKTNGTHVTETK